jgi:hypothetical protein
LPSVRAVVTDAAGKVGHAEATALICGPLDLLPRDAAPAAIKPQRELGRRPTRLDEGVRRTPAAMGLA